MSETIVKGQSRTNAAISAMGPGAGGGGGRSGSGGAGGCGGGGGGTTSAGDRASQFYTAEEILPYLSAGEKAALQQEVLTTINNELVHPEDLEVAVPRLLRSCVTEAKELRRSMTSISSSQIVESQRALQIVEASRKQVESLREIFVKQGDLIQGLGTESRSYQQLRQLHFLRDNIGAVIKWSLALKEVRYDNLFALVQDRQFAFMYGRLKGLQKIRKTVITKAGMQYRNYQAIFEPYFSKLDAVLAMFVAEVYAVLQEDTMVVAIQHALEDDPDDGATGGEDQFPDFTALKECIGVCSEEVEAPVLNFGRDGVELQPPIRAGLMDDAVAKNVARFWEDEIMGDVVDPYGQISIYLEQMKKVEPLLEALELTLIPLSTKFSFFGIVVEAIHSEVMHVMDGYLNPDADIEANGLMEASQFIQWYKEFITMGSYSQYVDVSSIDDMAAAFMTAAVGGLAAHLTRLCRACAITVCNDPKGPTILPSGYPVTTGPMDMFTVLQQTLGGLTASIDMGVLQQIGKACADAIYSYLDECRQRSDFDFWDDENEAQAHPEEAADWQQRRMTLLYAFVNDCTTIENNLDTVELKFASCWEFDVGMDDDGDDHHRAAAASSATATVQAAGGVDFGVSPFQRVQDALPDNVFFYLDEITGQVERVVGEQWATVFRSGPWYEDDENPLELIISTMAEYIDEEFAVMLQEQRLRKISRQMLVRYAQKYISTLLEFLGDVIRSPKKNAVDDWNAFIDCVTRDIDVAMGMWAEHAADGQGQLLALVQRALELIKGLLAVKKPVDFSYLIQEKLLDDFGDCPSFVVRFALEARSREIGRDVRDRMMAIWEERIAYQQRNKRTDLPTTGWSQPPSFYGGIDRSIANLDCATGFFGKSVKKKREEEQVRKAGEQKEAKRGARRARREADVAATKIRGPKAFRMPADQNVEVANLDDILK